MNDMVAGSANLPDSYRRFLSLRETISVRKARGVLPTGLIGEFVAGPENRTLAEFATHSVHQLAAFSPLVLYGASGTGKTALALSIASNYLAQSVDATDANSPLSSDQSTATFVNVADFCRQFYAAIEADDMLHFRRKYRTKRLLILDCLHELATKKLAQEELVRTLDSIHQNQGAVVLTSLRLPALIRELNPQLSSRLSGGLSIEIAPPSLPTKKILFRKIGKTLGIEIDEDAIDHLCLQTSNSATALELKSILQSWRVTGADHSRQENDEFLQQVLLDQKEKYEVSLVEIAKATARHFQIKLSEMRSATRKRQVVRARGIAILLMRELTEASLEQIGDYFGGRDHTTILHGLNRTKSTIESDTELMRANDDIRERLKR